MSNFGSGESYRRAEEDTSQWEDIHSKHKTEGYEYVKGIKQRLKSKRNEDWVKVHHDDDDAEKESAAILAEAENSSDCSDFEDEDEVEFLRKMREKRMRQLKEKTKKERYGTVRYIHRGEYVSEVTKSSEHCPVVLHLYQDYVPGCELMARALNAVAAKKKATKFLKIKATECIEGFPDSNCPCLIIYNEGKMTHKFTGLDRFGGKKINPDILEWQLAQADAVETTMEDNPLIDHLVADALEAKVQETLE